jgi:succinoglycan biosynthesis protein ExoO
MIARPRAAADVSVIVAAWKAVASVERAISSALSSTGVVVEVVAVDDASSDGTLEVLKRLAAADARVVADSLPVNSGPSAARNRAIELATGRYVAVLDADDQLAPDRLARLVALADSSGADIVIDNMIELDEEGRQTGLFLRSEAFAGARDIDLAVWVALNHPMKSADCLGYLKPLVRRSTLLESRVRYDPALRNSEDYYFVAQLLASGAWMTYCPDAGYLYRRSASSISHRLQPAQTKAWLEAEDRFHRRFAGRFSAKAEDALAVRARALRDVNQFVAAIEAVKTRQVGTFLGLLASDVRAAAFTLSTLAKIVLGKAVRRKLV